MSSDDGWDKISPEDKLADILFIDEKNLLAASWSKGVSVVTTDGVVQRRLLEGQATVHLQLANDRLFVGTWGKGLHIFSMTSVLP